MFDNNNLIFIFFRLFNFLVIVFIIAYFIKRFLKASILKQIKGRQKHFELLEFDYKKLNNDFQRIEQEKKELQIFAYDLKKKLYKWQKTFELEQMSKKNAYEKVKIDIQKDYEIKQKNITLKYLASKTLVNAVINTQNTLSKKFNDIEACRYQDKLIQFIKKES